MTSVALLGLRNPHQIEDDLDLASDPDRRIQGGGRVLIHHRDLVDPNLAELPCRPCG